MYYSDSFAFVGAKGSGPTTMLTRAGALLLAVLGLAGVDPAAAQQPAPPDGPLHNAEPVTGPIVAWVQDVIDGDTIVVRARIWLGQDVETRVRLFGIDAPELKSRCEEEHRLALAARDFVRDRILGRRVGLIHISYDKYDRRVLARVVTPDGEDLGSALIHRGLGRAYDGGVRQGWCAGKTH